MEVSCSTRLLRLWLVTVWVYLKACSKTLDLKKISCLRYFSEVDPRNELTNVSVLFDCVRCVRSNVTS